MLADPRQARRPQPDVLGFNEHGLPVVPEQGYQTSPGGAAIVLLVRSQEHAIRSRKRYGMIERVEASV